MVRKVRTHTDNVTGDISRLAPLRLTKQDFARRLKDKFRDKGWNQSELARRAGLTRDSISTYVRAKFSTPESLEKLATALGCTIEELLPNYKAGAIEADHPSFDIRSSGNPMEAWLMVDRLVTMKTALAVAEILNNDPLIQDKEKP